MLVLYTESVRGGVIKAASFKNMVFLYPLMDNHNPFLSPE